MSISTIGQLLHYVDWGSVHKAFSTLKEDTVFDLIGARGAYVNLFSTTSAKRSSSGR